MKSAFAAAFGFGGEILEEVPLARRVVDVVVEVDREELGRRADSGPDAIQDRDILRILGSLPYALPLASSAIDEFARAMLLARAPTTVEESQGLLTRVWKPAIDHVSFLVVAKDWKAALRRVSLFAADGPRGVGYVGATKKLGHAVREAERLGVGFAISTPDGPQVLSRASWATIRHDEQRWALLEDLLLRFRASLSLAG